MVDMFENLELFNAFITKDSAILTEAEKTFLNTEVTVENIVNEIYQRYLFFFLIIWAMECMALIQLRYKCTKSL